MTKPFIALLVFVLMACGLKAQVCFRDSVNCIRFNEHFYYDTVYNGAAGNAEDIHRVFRRNRWLKVYTQLKQTKGHLTIKELEHDLVTNYYFKDYARLFDSVCTANPADTDPLQLDVELVFDQRDCELYGKKDPLTIVRTPKTKKRYLFLYSVGGQTCFKYKLRRKKLQGLQRLVAYDRLIKEKRNGSF